MDQGPPLWQTGFEVRAYEVDAEGRLGVPSLCDWLQETAGQHASALGWAVEDLVPRRLTWVLSRLHVRVLRHPRWRERITVATWPSGVQRLFALRDFRACDASGEPVALATTAWLLLNLESRRPVRPPEEVEILARSSPGRAIDDGFARLPAAAPAVAVASFTARHTELDVNRHVNNVALIRWVVDSAPAATLGSDSLAELEIEFRAEVGWGDTVAARVEAADRPGRFVHGLARPDGQDAARACTAWVPA